MSLVTVVIPVSPKHRATGIYKDAIESVQKQRIPTAHVVIFDDQARGAAWARNRGMEQVDTPFVVFLDADDWIEAGFIERTLSSYRPAHYVSTQWVAHTAQGRQPRFTPVGQTIVNGPLPHHPTTLLPTVAFHQVGGFDETLETLEDEDFYKRLCLAGWRHIQHPDYLLHYRSAHGDSLINPHAYDLDDIAQTAKKMELLFEQRYGEAMRRCNCVRPSIPLGGDEAHQPDDVLAEVRYSHSVRSGPVSRRRYARAGRGDLLWVDPRDIAARPDWWAASLPHPEQVSPSTEQVRAVLAAHDEDSPIIIPSGQKINEVAKIVYS